MATETTIKGTLRRHAGGWSGAGFAVGPVIAVVFFFLAEANKETFAIADGRYLWAIVITFVLVLATASVIVFQSVADLVSEVNRLRNQSVVPRVTARKQEGKLHVFLVEPSPLLTHAAVVTIYNREDDGYEEIIGIGTVRNVQGNGFGSGSPTPGVRE